MQAQRSRAESLVKDWQRLLLQLLQRAEKRGQPNARTENVENGGVTPNMYLLWIELLDDLSSRGQAKQKKIKQHRAVSEQGLQHCKLNEEQMDVLNRAIKNHSSHGPLWQVRNALLPNTTE